MLSHLDQQDWDFPMGSTCWQIFFLALTESAGNSKSVKYGLCSTNLQESEPKQMSNKLFQFQNKQSDIQSYYDVNQALTLKYISADGL